MHAAPHSNSIISAHQRIEALAGLLASGYLRSRRGYVQDAPIGPVSHPVAVGATDGPDSSPDARVSPDGGTVADRDPAADPSILAGSGLEVGAEVGPHGGAR